MIPNGTILQDTSHNLYQDNFQRLIAIGTSISEAITAVTHRYLDGKPVKLSQSERDCLFWNSPFWAEVSNDVFETEVFALAFARYLKQNQVIQNALLQRVASCNYQVLQRAIRYSQVFLFPHEKHWKNIKKLNFTRNDNFSIFFNACKVLEQQYRQFKNKILLIETKLKPLSLLEILLYSSYYAFKNDIVLVHGKQLLLSHAQDRYSTWVQKVVDALNQILWAKLKTCSKRQFHLTEPILGKLLQNHLSPLLFPTPTTVPATKKIKHHLAIFEQLVEAYIQLNHFVSTSLSGFSFDDDYEIRFEGKKLILFPRQIPEQSNWDRNGIKLNRFNQYWFYRAIDEFIRLGFVEQIIGSPENYEANRWAVIMAIRIKLELTEIYGIDDEVTVDSGLKVDIFRALLSIELMTAFYKQAFVLPFCKHYQQTGDWKTALTLLALNGLVEGENRFAITFAERTAKIARMRNWTVSDQYPNGDEKMTEAIIDFWTYDLEELSVHLHQQKYAQLPELIERPLLKIDQYLFQLPWLIAQQNNVTAAVNNLRRFGKNRQEQKTETHRIEQRLAILFKSCGFHVLGNFQPAKDSSEVGEIDLICYQSDHLFIFEIKSGYIRKTPRDAWQHRTNTLRKAGRQLKRKSEWVVKSLETDATLANLISENSSSDKLKIHSWIIDTSIEHDHEYFSNFLKVSLQEVQMALLNKRHFLRDIEEKIFSTIRHRRPDNEDIIDQIETIIANFSKQKPIDNLYPQGFSAERFAEIIEMGMMWEEL